MPKEAIHSKHAPAALGPYSQGVRAGDTVYLSGQLGLDPATGNLAEGIDAQAHQVFRNLRAVAQAAGGELDDVVKLTLLPVEFGGLLAEEPVDVRVAPVDVDAVGGHEGLDAGGRVAEGGCARGRGDTGASASRLLIDPAAAQS